MHFQRHFCAIQNAEVCFTDAPTAKRNLLAVDATSASWVTEVPSH
jgi:hypothetical protein